MGKSRNQRGEIRTEYYLALAKSKKVREWQLAVLNNPTFSRSIVKSHIQVNGLGSYSLLEIETFIIALGCQQALLQL